MEVAGLAIGIAGLAGQTISGIAKLKSFFAAYKLAHAKVTTLHFELESLASTLSDAQKLLRKVSEGDQRTQGWYQQQSLQRPLPPPLLLPLSKEAGSWELVTKDSPGEETPVKLLELRITRCSVELTAWNNASSGLSIGVWTDMRAFAKRIKIATSKDLFDEIAARISAHRQAIGNSLSSLTLYVGARFSSLQRTAG